MKACLLDDEEVWTAENLVKVDAEKRIEVKHRIWNLQESFRAKRQNAAERLAETIGLVIELFGDTVVSSPDKVGITDPPNDELTG